MNHVICPSFPCLSSFFFILDCCYLQETQRSAIRFLMSLSSSNLLFFFLLQIHKQKPLRHYVVLDFLSFSRFLRTGSIRQRPKEKMFGSVLGFLIISIFSLPSFILSLYLSYYRWAVGLLSINHSFFHRPTLGRLIAANLLSLLMIEFQAG